MSKTVKLKILVNEELIMAQSEDGTWNEERFQKFNNLMRDDSPIAKAIACRSLVHNPSGDPRVLPNLENALEDNRICVISKPITYSEVRFWAAYALSAERKKQFIQKIFTLQQTFLPLTVDDAMNIILPNNEIIPREIRLRSTEAKLMFLREKGFLELGYIRFDVD